MELQEVAREKSLGGPPKLSPGFLNDHILHNYHAVLQLANGHWYTPQSLFIFHQFCMLLCVYVWFHAILLKN